MKSPHDNPLSGSAVPPASYEETLRLLARVPVPAGIEQRVQAALEARFRNGRVLSWPHSGEAAGILGASAWMRAAAAAAIVTVVAGGGWGVYHRVQHPMAKALVMPVAQPAAAGGFSTAGAIRTPQSVKRPLLVQPAADTAKREDGKKPAARRTKRLAAPAKPASATATAVQR